MPKKVVVKLYFAIAFASAATPAFAYIDPGTGAMLVQAILAVLAACVFYLRNPRHIWRDLKRWLNSNNRR